MASIWRNSLISSVICQDEVILELTVLLIQHNGYPYKAGICERSCTQETVSHLQRAPEAHIYIPNGSHCGGSF